MNAIENARIRKLIAATPGPTPWYVDSMPLPVASRDACRWSYENEQVVLRRGDARVLLLPAYIWVFHAAGSVLWLWRLLKSGQRYGEEHFEICAYDVDELSPIDGSREPTDIAAQGPIAESIRFPSQRPAGVHPDSEIGRRPNCREVFLLAQHPHEVVPFAHQFENWDHPATVVHIWRPSRSEVEVVPQKWLRADKMDLGYQWITRVTRDSKTGRLVGGGIRISDFELEDDDTTLRRLLPPA